MNKHEIDKSRYTIGVDPAGKGDSMGAKVIFEGSEEELRKNVFDMDKIGEALANLKKDDWKYFIGVSDNAYCLVKINSKGYTEIIVSNTGEKRKIEKQIEVLAEVFNAKINRE